MATIVSSLRIHSKPNSSKKYEVQGYKPRQRSYYKTMNSDEIYELSRRLSSPKYGFIEKCVLSASPRSVDVRNAATGENEVIEPVVVPLKEIANRNRIDRLATPKTYHSQYEFGQNLRRRKKNTDDLNKITVRLCDRKQCEKETCNKPTHPEKNPDTLRKTISTTEVEEITERLSILHKRKESTSPNRGKAKLIYDLENFVDRISTPKPKRERPVSRKVLIEKRTLKAEEIIDLCGRLADKEYARAHTPDTKRIIDKTFMPVNTYSWQDIHCSDFHMRFPYVR